MYEGFYLRTLTEIHGSIGLYGGSFNPVHKAHTALCEYVLGHTDLERIWLTVSPANPLKRDTSLMDDELRLRLARLAAGDCEGIDVCDAEFSLPRPSYTINTLNYLRSEYPAARFTLIMGADNVLGFGRWKDHELILRDFAIIALRRPGYDSSRAEELFPQIRFLDSPLYDISSTMIRERLKNGQSISGLVCPAVEGELLKIVGEEGYGGLFKRLEVRG